ncbi:hypothetical protein D1872_228070 [compost metagenome]
MDHHHGVFRHDDRIADHRDHRRHGSRQAVNMHSDRGAMIFQGIKNGDAVKNIATRGVDMQINLGNVTQCLQIFNKLLGRDPPVADLVIDVDIGGAVGLGLHAKPGVISSGVRSRTMTRPISLLRHWCLLCRWRDRYQTPAPACCFRQFQLCDGA